MKKKYDVVIIGGGTSGCACAYNCSKFGLKTALIEKNNFLGGLMTGGLVVPVMKSSTSNLNCDYYKKLIKCAKKYNAQIKYFDGNDGWLNPEVLKIVFDDLLSSSNIKKNLDIYFESTLENVVLKNKKISYIQICNNLLSIPIVAKYFIDATGSGDLIKKSGAKFLGDVSQKQQNTLRFILSNVDVQKFCDFILKFDKDRNITNSCKIGDDTYFTTACTWDTKTKWALDELLKQGVKDKVLKNSDRSYFQIFSVAKSTNQVAFNCPRIENYCNNPLEYSNELINARKAIYRLYMFCKRYFSGFENAEIANIATITGIREENRLNSKYVFSSSDLISGKEFDNCVLDANYSIDIHSKNKNKSKLIKTSTYHLPIESLISDDISNLYAIGKLVGADFTAHSALRVQKSCMSMGEGLAKYIKKNS